MSIFSSSWTRKGTCVTDLATNEQIKYVLRRVLVLIRRIKRTQPFFDDASYKRHRGSVIGSQSVIMESNLNAASVLRREILYSVCDLNRILICALTHA